MDSALNRRVKEQLASVLIRHVEPIFKHGTELTIIARTPGNAEADVLVTSETDLAQLRALIDRSIKREPIDSQIAKESK